MKDPKTGHLLAPDTIHDHHRRLRQPGRACGAVSPPRRAHPPMDGPGGLGGHRGHGGGRHGGGPGGRQARGPHRFEPGAIKLLALSLVAEGPCHGYDLIKFIEGLVGGDYSPSPGVIYPTLAFLVDRGWATVADGEDGRKRYLATQAGLDQLAGQRAELTALLQRLQMVREGSLARRSPDIEHAMGQLKAALQARFAQGSGNADLARRVAAHIEQAALAIRQLEA